MVSILYGSGLTLAEYLEIRAKDMDLERLELTVREGKGEKRPADDDLPGGGWRAARTSGTREEAP